MRGGRRGEGDEGRETRGGRRGEGDEGREMRGRRQGISREEVITHSRSIWVNNVHVCV